MKVKIEVFDDPDTVVAMTRCLPDVKRKVVDGCLKSSSVVWLGLADNKVACVWGVALPTLLSNRAYLWLWTSEIVKEHPFIFVRRAQMVIKELLEEYEVVTGVVDASDPGVTSSVRWLKLLGAKFGLPSDGLIPFQIRKV